MAEEKIAPLYLEEEMRKSYLSYAMSVIVGRALPDVRDGLKPVQRRILYAMQGLGLTSNKPYRKSARLVGEVLGKYHPHGDMAVYDALVRMAQDFSLRYPLIDGQGNFGSIDGDPPAAMRYTEVRLSSIAEELLEDLDKGTVDFIPNFDNSLEEPVVLPAKFPNLLLNGSSGIAVGMATNIPPHNLGELIDGCVRMIEHPQITVNELLEVIKGPDFPTGGIILKEKGIEEAYEKGRGKIVLRGKAQIKEEGGKEKIIIQEIPYQVNKTKLIEKIADLAGEEKIKGIKAVRDESDKMGIRVVVELSRLANPEVVLNQLYKYTPLQITFGIIFLALVDGKPQLLTLTQAIKCYLEHRREIVIRRTHFLLEKEEKKAHILEGLKKALGKLNEVIEIIRSSSNPKEAKQSLIEFLSLTETQAQAILDMRLQRLTGLEREKIEKDYQIAVKNIQGFKRILASDEEIWAIIKNELIQIKDKYATPRRTSIEKKIKKLFFKPEDLIEKEDIIVTVTSQGYIKSTPLRAYKRQKRGGKGISGISLDRGDIVRDSFMCNTHSTLLLFTNLGRVYSIKAYDIPEKKRGGRGKALVNFLALKEKEKITAAIPVDSSNSGQFLFMTTRKGIVKKTPFSQFTRIFRGGIIAINLREKDKLIRVLLTSGDDDVLLCTKNGKAIRFSEGDVRALGRASMGVKGISLKENDEVKDATLVKENESLFTITSRGYGKRTPFSQYRKTKRGGKGIINIHLHPDRGKVVAIKKINKKDEVVIISKKGKSIRLLAKDIRLSGRNTMGICIIKLSRDDEVIGIT
ncbi:DNA gyrase subunit A [Candidatus Aerophobetes bacterium]|nr:DNA gyrase subunit A [Candidatus Aerophobetes bacterium]